MGMEMLELTKEIKGKILDIGGGGEGIIGRLYRWQVTAIDNRKEELDEAPNGFEKILMDATELQYAENAFDNVTFFYSLMFMNEKDQQIALREAARVVKENGEIHIWDCKIDTAYPQPFCIDVDVKLPDEKIHTTYGVGKCDTQSEQSIRKMCENAGLEVETVEADGKQFYMKCKKV